MINMDNNKTKEALSDNAPWYFRSGPLVAVLLVTALTLIIYLPAVNAFFMLDDEVNIVRNLRLHDLSNFWPPAGSRYLAYLSFALNYALGGLHTRGYHLVNMLLHILSAMTLYGLIRSLFQTPAMGGGLKGENGPGNHIALITALIFTVHPLNTQAVIYVTQRLTVMASLFYLLSLYLYIKWRLKGHGGLSIIFYALSIIAAIAAAKTKEISFTLPFVIVLAEYVFFTEQGRWISKKRLYALIPYALVLIIIPLAVFGPEMGLWSGKTVVDEGLTRVQQILDIKELSSYTYLLTQFTVVPKYIRLFLIPLGQNLDYDYPLYHSLFNLRVMAGFLFLLFIFTSTLLTVSFAKKTKKPLLLLATTGLLWFFITLSIESTVIPIQDVIFEHRMYLPGAGLGVALSTLIVYLAVGHGKRAAGKALFVAALIVIIPLTTLAFRRSLLWGDGIGLYEDIVRKSPEKARARNNLGTLYARSGRFDKAIGQFKKAITMESDYPAPHKNLGRALFASGRTIEAREEFKAAIRDEPGDFEAHEALAGLYRDAGLFSKSEKEYKIVLSLTPSNMNVRVNLANVYIVEKRFGEAIAEFKKILIMNPGRVDVYYNLALALEKAGSTEEALYYYRKFVTNAPAGLSAYREQALGRIEGLELKKR